jgi:chromosomal replication initiator protein
LTTTEANNTWATTAWLGETLCGRIGPQRYGLWFAGKTKFTWHDDVLVIGVANHFYLEWLQKTFSADLAVVAAGALRGSARLRFVIDPELFQEARRKEAPQQRLETSPSATPVAATPAAATPSSVMPSSATASLVRGSLSEDQGSQEHSPHDLPTLAGRGATGQGRRPRDHGRRWRRLADFVVGPCNRLGHAAAESIVEEPEQAPTPLVLHGPVGTGKTHLLEGIYAGLRQTRPAWRLCYATAEDFTNRFVQAMRLGKLTVFRKHFRECDVLVLDDVHFLTGKRATQEEFLHTLTALLADERQVVLSCDCHPRLADEFLPELANRLLGGAVWGLAPPERETRLNLLRAKAGKTGTAVPEDVLTFLAEQLYGNVRELEGAWHSVKHLARVAGRRIDLALAREAAGDLLRHSVRLLQLADVEGAVCSVLGVGPAVLQSRQRGWAFCYPRMLAMYLARKHTGATYAEIGRRFGGRNHSTTVAAEKKVRRWLQEDSTLRLGERKIRVRDLIDRVGQELSR